MPADIHLDGVEVLNAQDATNEQFDALADVVSDVSNVEQWYLEERRDFINGLQAFCEERNYPFPFTIVDEEGTPTTPLHQSRGGTQRMLSGLSVKWRWYDWICSRSWSL